MTIKHEAAYHEAGHAVAAHFSQFHAIVGPIDLGLYGSGEIYISLNKTKVTAANKRADPSIAKDKDVAQDLAIVLCAGLVAERIAAKKMGGLIPNEQCALPDYDLMKQQLAAAGLSKHFDRHEAAAANILKKKWSIVDALAKFLYAQISVNAWDVLDFIEEQQDLQSDD